MELISTTDILVGSCVKEEKRANFSVSFYEAIALANALRLIQNYKLAAFKALNKKSGDSDWCEVEFGVDKLNVSVTVRKGSTG